MQTSRLTDEYFY